MIDDGSKGWTVAQFTPEELRQQAAFCLGAQQAVFETIPINRIPAFDYLGPYQAAAEAGHKAATELYEIARAHHRAIKVQK